MIKFSGVFTAEEELLLKQPTAAEWDYIRAIEYLANDVDSDTVYRAYESTKLTDEDQQLLRDEIDSAESSLREPALYKAYKHENATAGLYYTLLMQSSIKHMHGVLEDRFMLWNSQTGFKLMRELYQGANYTPSDKKKSGIIVVDIEGFKHMNDLYGYDQTDKIGFFVFGSIRLHVERRRDYTPVWKKILLHEKVNPRARLVAAQIKTGDEAVFIFPQINSPQLLHEFEEELRADINDPDGPTLRVERVDENDRGIGIFEEVRPREHVASCILHGNEDPAASCHRLLGKEIKAQKKRSKETQGAEVVAAH